MTHTGTVVASALVGAAIGAGVAMLVSRPPCGNHLVVVDTSSTSLSSIRVCVSQGHVVRWEGRNGALLKVVPKGTAPFPYTLNCGTFAAACSSGPISPSATTGTANYEVTVQGGPIMNGRMIIDK